jgi:hypothetical protein
VGSEMCIRDRCSINARYARFKKKNLNSGNLNVINTSKSMYATCSDCKAHLQVLYRVSRMSAAEWLRLLVLLHGLCWIGSLCLTTLLPGYMSRICAQLWPAEYTRFQPFSFQPFSIETSCPLTALQYMQLRLLLRKGSLRLSTLWPRLNKALQNLTTPALWIVGQEEERVPADFYLALKTS